MPPNSLSGMYKFFYISFSSSFYCTVPRYVNSLVGIELCAYVILRLQRKGRRRVVRSEILNDQSREREWERRRENEKEHSLSLFVSFSYFARLMLVNFTVERMLGGMINCDSIYSEHKSGLDEHGSGCDTRLVTISPFQRRLAGGLRFPDRIFSGQPYYTEIQSLRLAQSNIQFWRFRRWGRLHNCTVHHHAHRVVWYLH